MTQTTDTLSVLSVPTPTKTKWQKFVAFLSCCWQVTAPIMNGAISLGVDAASDALKNQISSDANLNDAQKRALSALTEKGIKGITGAVKARLDAEAAKHASEIDPSMAAAGSALVSGAIALGAVEAISPELAQKVRTTAEAPLNHPIMTKGKLKAIVNKVTSDKATILNLSAADHALVLRDSVLKNIIEEAIRASGLPKANQDALIKTGAALAFISTYIDMSNQVHQISATSGAISVAAPSQDEHRSDLPMLATADLTDTSAPGTGIDPATHQSDVQVQVIGDQHA